MLKKVISGGQTGADRAGLIAAKRYGLQTGGWMPKGFRAQDGNWPQFATDYGIQEHTSPEYPPRTAANVRDSDGTVRFAVNWSSPGEVLTLEFIKRYGKPYLDIDPRNEQHDPARAARWIIDNNIQVLNIAGNSAKWCAELEEFVIAFLSFTFSLLEEMRKD